MIEMCRAQLSVGDEADRRGSERSLRSLAQQFVIELADLLDGYLQPLIVVQPLTNLISPFAPDAELPRAPAGIAHCQHEYPMAFTACTFGAVAAVPHGAFQEQAPQKLTSNRELAKQFLAYLKGSISNHLHR